jgi:hypothetical protein
MGKQSHVTGSLQRLRVLAVLLVEADGGERRRERLNLVLQGVDLGELPPGRVGQRLPEVLQLRAVGLRDVAAQEALCLQILKPGVHFIGSKG